MAPVKKPTHPLDRTFLREWREHAGYDQETAAAQLNVSRTLLSKIENARSPYSQRILERAAELYRCTAAELLIHNPEDPNSLWRLWARAERTSGDRREQIRKLIAIGLGEN